MADITYNGLLEKIREGRGRRVGVSFHSMGDTDAIASALALSYIFDDIKIISPDRMTANAERIKDILGFKEFKMINSINKNDFDLIILVDVNNIEGCGRIKEQLRAFGKDIIIIDHHLKKDNAKNFIVFNDEQFNSTASIIFELLKDLKIKLDSKIANMLAMGIISDSAEFKNTTPKTFIQLGELFSIAGINYITLMDMTRHISPAEERIKTINDIRNASVSVVNNMLLMKGAAHAYSNLAAESALRIGADVAIFGSRSESEISFSARLRPNLDQKYNIHLGSIMDKLSKIIDGSGGGHPCAAGAYGKNKDKFEEFINAFISEISNAGSVK